MKRFGILSIISFIGIIAVILVRRGLTIQTPQESGLVGSAIISGSLDPNKYRPDVEWRKMLTPEQYHILREKGTDIPFTGALDKEDRPGTYYSAGCNEPVFRSEQKFDSGTGWPSFMAPITNDALVLQEDNSIPNEPRVEVLDICGGHLGHVFDDGPRGALPDGRQATGKRYCMNSTALYFVPD